MENFLKKIFRGGQSTLQAGARKVIDLFEQQPDEMNRPATRAEKTGKAVADYFKPAAKPVNPTAKPGDQDFGVYKPDVRVRDVVREAPKAIATTVGAPILRSVAALAQKGITLDPKAKYVPETPFEKSFFNTDKPVTFTSIGKETRLAGEDDATIPVLDPVLGGVIAMLDAPSGGRASQVAKGTVKAGAKAFEGATNYTTKVLDALQGKTQVSRQFIEDLLKKPDIKQAERDLVESVLRETPDTGKIDVPRFAEAVEEKVLPLTTPTSKEAKASKDVILQRLNREGYEFEQDMDGGGYLLKDDEIVDYDELPNNIRQDLNTLVGDADNYNDAMRPYTDRYESVNLPEKQRGTVAVYREKIYESPVKTNAGSIHFGSATQNYFGHSRIEDLPAKTMDFQIGPAEGARGLAVMVKNPYEEGTSRIVAEGFKSEADAQKYIDSLPEGGTRRVIELQSDLFQRGRLENEASDTAGVEWTRRLQQVPQDDGTVKYYDPIENKMYSAAEARAERIRVQKDRAEAIKKLEAYKNTWWQRMVREEVKDAAKAGKTKLQFPTGETAMKVEGLANYSGQWDAVTRFGDRVGLLTKDNIKPEMEVANKANGTRWIVAKVNDDGTFKAVEKEKLNEYIKEMKDDGYPISIREALDAAEDSNITESFDIMGGYENNPIFKFYEKDVANYLTKKYDARIVTDAQGVKWVEVDIKPNQANTPVEAFGVAAGLETDEEGNVEFNPLGALLGIGAIGATRAVKGAVPEIKFPKRIVEAVRADVAKENFTDIPGIQPDKVKSVKLFGSSVEGKLQPNDIDVFVTVADDAAKWKTKGGMIEPKTFDRGRFSYVVMPESEADDLLQAMLYTGRKDPDRAYSGTAVVLPKRLWNSVGAETEIAAKSVGDVLRARKGTIPPPPAQGVKTMADMLGKGKERRFITRTKTMEGGTEKFLDGAYTTKTNDELTKAATAMIKSDFEKAREYAMTGTDDTAVAVATQLIDGYVTQARKAKDAGAKEELWKAAAEVANEAARTLTEHGRAIQAAALLGRMTPEGMVRYASRVIQNHNSTVTKQQGPLAQGIGNIFGTPQGKSMKQVPELTGEQAEKIVSKMKAIQETADDLERAKKTQELMDDINAILPSSLYEKIVTVWKAGLLTGLKTTGLNVLSNTSHFLMEMVKDIPATAVDRIASLFTGKRTMALTGRGTGKGLKDGAKKGWTYLTSGFDERDIGAKLDYRKVNFGESKLAKAIQTYEETVFRFIGSQDQPFYYATKMRSLSSQAIAAAKNAGLKGKDAKAYVENLLQNPTDDMLKYATLDAETAVFQNQTTLGRAARAIQRLPGGQIVLPFAKTPSAVATQIINYSPVGVVKTIIENIGKGKFDQRVFSQQMGRGITGTGAVAIGMALYEAGKMQLEYPTSERERAQWELEGKNSASINVDGQWRSASVLGPGGLLAIIGGHYQKGLDETGSMSGALARAAAGFGNTLTEQSFLKGINSAIEALNDPERSFQGFASSLAGSIVPTIIADIARTADDFERVTKTPGERIQSRIPGLRENLEPKVDTLGNTIDTPGTFTTMFDPTRPGNPSMTPEDKPIVDELRRLSDAGYPTTPTRLVPRGGYESLSNEDNTYLARLSGIATKESIKRAMESRTYRKLDDEQKSEFLQDVVTDAKVEARARAALRATEGLEGRALIDKLAAMKEDGLLTKQVFAKYQSLKRNQ